MTNYNNGKIYKIESTLGDKVYYGSTTKQYLSQRMTRHRGDYNRWLKGKRDAVTVFKLFDEYSLENCKIILVENYPCESKDELKTREAYYIRNFECVNKNIPNRTRKEWCEDNKEKLLEYREVNKDKILEYGKEYREVNKDKLSEQRKKYRENNKDKILEQKKKYYEDNKNKTKKYYEDNKNKILERMKIKHTCICGSCICTGDKARHEKTKKHIKFLESQ